MVEELRKDSVNPDDEEKNEREMKENNAVDEVEETKENNQVTDQENIKEVSDSESEQQVQDDHSELKEQLEQVQKEKDEFYEQMLRIKAEYENYKRRTQKERAADLKYKSQDLVNEILPVLDNFERALAVEETDATKGIIEGITMVRDQLMNALNSQGVEVIETVGKEFDPNLHHAVMQEEDEEKESNIITEEMQKGYMLKDRVIRAAMVKVNK